MVISMKTTLEIPDGLYRQIKARAALKGQTIKSFFLDAIQDKLIAERDGGNKTPGWRSVFGKASKDDISQLQQILDDEFSRIDAEAWE